MTMFPSEWSLFTCHRFWMLIQTFYLFNAFSLPWNMRGAPRDHQFYFRHRLNFLNTETLFCQIIRSSLNGVAFIPECAFRHPGWIWLTAKRNTLPFYLHSIWREAVSYTLKIKPRYPYLPVCTSWPHTLTMKTTSDKDALKHFFLLSVSLFYPCLFSPGYLFLWLQREHLQQVFKL